MVLVNTVKENMEGFTRQKIAEENTSKLTMAKLGYTLEVYYKDMVRSNMIAHCTLDPADIDAANNIFDHDITSLN